VTASAVASVALLALLVLGAFLARGRAGRGSASGAPEVTGRTVLSREAGVAVVRAGGQEVLVGWGRDGVRLLARLGPERAR
jgi:hypothetical protein